MDKPTDNTTLTAAHLQEADKKWLRMGGLSPLHWIIKVAELKARFQLEGLPWLPAGGTEIEVMAEDIGHYIQICINPRRLVGGPSDGLF